MKNLCLIVCLMALVISCSDKDRLPSRVLPQKEMQLLMWDLMRADNFLGTYVIDRGDTPVNRTTESLKYYQRIFSIHHITREQFQESFNYYRNHPALFKALMDSISGPTLADLPVLANPVPATVSPDTPRIIPPVKTGDSLPARKKKQVVPF